MSAVTHAAPLDVVTVPAAGYENVHCGQSAGPDYG